MPHPEIDAIIAELAALPAPPDAVNMYAAAGPPGNELRRRNLALALELALPRGPDLLLVGEAPGYNGARRTGVPFTSERLLLEGLGPGKMALLDAVRRTGSIVAAGQEMNMSYRRALMLIDSVNAMFDEPAVQTAPGPAESAASRLTDLGHALLAAYHATEAQTREAVARNFAPLLPRLRGEAPGPRSARPGSGTD